VVVALAIVYVGWGSTPVAMKVAVRGLPPLSLSAFRFLVAGALLYGWCAWQRRRHPDRGWRPPTAVQWRSGTILGLLLPAAGTGGATWAEQKLSAGTAALLLATIPVWMVIGSRIADGQRISGRAAAGLVAGIAGVGVLINPLTGRAPDLTACAVTLAGAMCWGLGSVYARRAPLPDQPLLASATEMISGGLALGVLGAVSGEYGRLRLAELSTTSGWSLLYLIVIGSLLVFSIYQWLLGHAPSRVVGTYAFVNPVIAVLLGWWLLAEHADGRTALATVIIVAGVILMMAPSGDTAASRPTEGPPRPAEAGQRLPQAAGPCSATEVAGQGPEPERTSALSSVTYCPETPPRSRRRSVPR
jgi:drug/metabolite transporter (DMT)-like permease